MGQDTIDAPSAPPAARGGRRGRATRRLDPSRPCLNCGDETPGRYCPSCGQRKADIQVSLRALIADALEDELTLDRRLPATLGALFLEPGQLTVDYVNGRIARYVRPVRLYLVSSIIFFLVLTFLSLQLLRDVMEPGETDDPAVVAEEVTLDQLDDALAGLEVAMAEPGLPEPALTVLQGRRDQLLQERAALEAAPGTAEESRPEDPAPGPAGETDPAAASESDGWADAMAALEGAEFGGVHPAIAAAAQAKIRQLGRMGPREAAERIAADFLRYAPTMMFILLPLFGLVLKLLYIRRRRFYAEHFIFLLHTHAFIFLQFTVLLLLVLPGWAPGWLVAGVIGWIVLYTYMAMKRVYGQGWLKTLVKWWTLGWVYFWILVVTVPIAFLVTALLA